MNRATLLLTKFKLLLPIAFLGLFVINVEAHPGEGSAPLQRHQLTIKFVDFPPVRGLIQPMVPSFPVETGGTAELLLFLQWNHVGHETGMRQIVDRQASGAMIHTSRIPERGVYNHNPLQTGWLFPGSEVSSNQGNIDSAFNQGLEIYTHDECSPESPIVITGHLIELDTEATEGVISSIAGAVIPPPFDALVGSAVSLDGHDDLGYLNFVAGESDGWLGHPDFYFYKTKHFLDSEKNPTGPLLAYEHNRGYLNAEASQAACPQGSSGEQDQSGTRVGALFNPLNEAFALVPGIQPESENPAGLTQERIDAIQKSFYQIILGISEISVAHELTTAAPYRGSELALSNFLTGKELVHEGNLPQALETFEVAYASAIEANTVKILRDSPLEIPLGISLSTTFLSTNQEKTAEVIAYVSGTPSGDNIPALSIPNLPLGLGLEVIPGEIPGMFLLRFELSENTPITTHALDIVAQIGDEKIRSGLTLKVNPPTGLITSVGETDEQPPLEDSPSLITGIDDSDVLTDDTAQSETLSSTEGLLDQRDIALNLVCSSNVDDYASSSRSFTENDWQPPRPPRRGEWVTLLEYYVARDGTANEISMIKSSGYAPLDASTIASINAFSGRFPPFPDCYTGDYIFIEHRFTLLYF
ncbi:MAG: TonB C-terminal domain-containing protein [Cyanobacteria bacterium P01_D01_bin.156]